MKNQAKWRAKCAGIAALAVACALVAAPIGSASAIAPSPGDIDDCAFGQGAGVDQCEAAAAAAPAARRRERFHVLTPAVRHASPRAKIETIARPEHDARVGPRCCGWDADEDVLVGPCRRGGGPCLLRRRRRQPERHPDRDDGRAARDVRRASGTAEAGARLPTRSHAFLCVARGPHALFSATSVPTCCRIATAVGEPVFAGVRDGGAELSACDSETCRWWISEKTGVPSVHPVELLRRSYRLPLD